ncbi:MAG: hypothetical protein Q9184_002170 [Pyrenodesmia sp. 2 TL-2023]
MYLTLSILAQLALVSTAIPPHKALASNYYCTAPFFPYVHAYLNDTLNGYWLKAPTPLADSTYAVLEKDLSSTSFTKTACWNGTDEDIKAGRGSLRFKGEDSPHGLLRWDYSYELVIEEFNQTYRPMRIKKGVRSGIYGYGMGSTSKISPGYLACNTQIFGKAVIQLFRTAPTVAVPCECTVVSICGDSNSPEVGAEGTSHPHQVEASTASTAGTAEGVALLLGILCAMIALS